jgi:hypothetical protein
MKLLKAACYRRYSTARAYELGRYRRRVEGRTPVLVYQMGKVGSCSVYHSLKGRPGLAPLHLHYLTSRRLAVVDEDNRRGFRRNGWISRHLLDGLYVADRLKRGGFPQGLKIITLTRDPISRSVSAFFHFTEPDAPRERLEGRDPWEAARELEPRFRERFEKDRHRPRDWFESELRAVFGIDVLAQPFPRDQGYAVQRHGELELLVLKLERLNECAGEAMREFLGIEGFELRRKNEARDRGYYPVYRAFQELVRFPEACVEEVYASPYVRHFYSDAELDGFRRRWTAASPAPAPARAGAADGE